MKRPDDFGVVMELSPNRFWFVYGVLCGVGAEKALNGEYPQACFLLAMGVFGLLYVFQPWKTA